MRVTPNWLSHVNAPQIERELAALRLAVSRGQPFGDDSWQQRTAKRLGLEYTLHPRGRPRKHPSPHE
jgi:putative transposase